jgi:HSP20 family protein
MNLPFFATDFSRDFDAVRSQMDEMFRNLGLPSNLRSFNRGTFPALNVGGTDETIEVVMFAPGVDPANLQVTIDKGLLSVSGERQRPELPERDVVTVYAEERPAGKFRRIVELPQEADPDRVEAHYKDGCLRVSVHKRESSKPRLVQVQ